jgi:hypothetical protein
LYLDEFGNVLNLRLGFYVGNRPRKGFLGEQEGRPCAQQASWLVVLCSIEEKTRILVLNLSANVAD